MMDTDRRTEWDMVVNDDTLHVYPDDHSHDLNVNCWCAPDLECLCPQCRGVGDECWKCDGYGQVVGSALDPRRVVQVNHREFTGADA